MRSKKQQVLLCGTQYGQTYLPAIFESKNLELAAILARGSDRSVRMAEQAGVYLYHEVEEIEVPIDIACVAIGEEQGIPIALKLLRIGIPVLIEHPISAKGFKDLQQTAKEHQTRCHINSHFADIPPIDNFIQQAKGLNLEYKPLVITASANSRTLFSLLDILMRCMSKIEEFKYQIQPLNDEGSYQNITFTIHGVPCTITYQRWRGEQDDSKDAPLGHQITMTYPIGTLQLAGTFGPCIWSPLVAAGLDWNVPIHSLTEVPDTVTIHTLITWRINANKKVIQLLCEAVTKSNTMVTASQHEFYLSTLTSCWTRLFEDLGTPITYQVVQELPRKFWLLSN